MKRKRVAVITEHVRQQARQRFRITDETALDALITHDVETGQLLNHKPKPFRLYHEKNRPFLGNQRFVMSGNGQRGYIVDENDGRCIVITALLRLS